AARVRAALEADLADPALGGHVVVRAAALDDAGATYAVGDGPVIPASTTKLLTTTAALQVLGPDHVFTTRVVRGAGRREIVLVGGGDPYLMSKPLTAKEQATSYPPRADIVTLARQTAGSLRADGVGRVTVTFDDSLFPGPAFNPHWEPSYRTDEVVAPISALWVDEGRPATGFGRVPDPSLRAAQVFAAALRRQGITVSGSPVHATAPAGAVELAAVDSAPLAEIVQRVLDVSDNEAAEVLAHHVGEATVGEATFDGGVRGVMQTLRRLGVPLAGAQIFDGSGLSREDRLDPDTLLAVLRVAADPDHPDLRAVVTGLPVAGFTGSLAYRFGDAAAAGRGVVRAKTGTLTGVHGLAGLVTDADGGLVVFVAIADDVAVINTLAARDALDRMAAGLAGCGCTRGTAP
ncbi:MAG: D-alanyl-D-alanine carboxypeptidase/D-alanyl-D-alanine-endopeptidase, partial [Nocardioidaceae bacterium]|nr:D-alanyl-D-alanine carboxypeptidase/D-alanyl-D-alanine-endopeptidase [Nocardioidaceae bacterium]